MGNTKYELRGTKYEIYGVRGKDYPKSYLTTLERIKNGLR